MKLVALKDDLDWFYLLGLLDALMAKGMRNKDRTKEIYKQIERQIE